MARTIPPPAYQLLFSLEVVHAYFSTPSRLRLRAEPDAATRAWMVRTGCRARTVGNVLQVYFEAERNGPSRATAQAPVQLRFGLYAPDRDFARYTAGLTDMDRPPLTYLGEQTAESGGAWPIKPLAAAEPWADGPRPDLVIVIPLSAERTPRAATPDQAATPARTYSIALQARESVWKYVLLGDWADISVNVRELAAASGAPAITFSSDEVLLPDGRRAPALRASSALPMREGVGARFELSGALGSGGTFKHPLPVPAPANLALDGGDPGVPFVSEIFVSRLEPLRP